MRTLFYQPFWIALLVVNHMQNLECAPQCLRIGGKISQLLVSIGLYNAVMMNITYNKIL